MTTTNLMSDFSSVGNPDQDIRDADGRISLAHALGKNYNDIFNCRKRYVMIRGAKGSKKTFNVAQILIYRIMAYPMSNAVVLRKAFSSIRETTYTDLLKAITRLGVDDLWEHYTAPLMLRYKPTGQVILFRGLDKAEKLGGLTVPVGYMCWEWIDEFSEITSKDEFTKLNMGIRGAIPEQYGLWKQIICTFNPWTEHAWFKAEFFDQPRDDTYCKVVTFRDNEFLGEDDIASYLDLYERSPRLARIICDGEWGIAEGLVYENWDIIAFDKDELLKNPDNVETFGIDFGFAESKMAFIGAVVNPYTRDIWIFEDSIYDTKMTLLDVAKRITELGYADRAIWADSASPQNIYELKSGIIEEVFDVNGNAKTTKYVLPGIRGAMKGNASVKNGILRLQSFRIHVFPGLKNVISELSSYCYKKDKDGRYTGDVEKENDHLLDALRYGCTPFMAKSHGRVSEVGGSDRDFLPSRVSSATPRIIDMELVSEPQVQGASARQIYTPVRRVRRVASSRPTTD